jgi:2,3-bisphosphoglycerate-independent phosphoglycerate mutase
VVAVLVVLDGASEPLGFEPTSLERARTPVLDGLAARGELTRLRTVPDGLPVGSETAIPTLLGWTPQALVDRGALEAAGHGVILAAGERAWRIDVFDRGGERADARTARAMTAELLACAPHHATLWLSGHRLLLTGPAPLPHAVRRSSLRPWPEGTMPDRVLDAGAVMVAARGAAAGIARLMGARVRVPPGATGQPDTDLEAKASCALEEIASDARHVIVHVGAPDEAAHRRDRAGKVAVLERIDSELLAPLAAAVSRAGGTLRVCPDHGCDPATGVHDPSPVPCLDWPGKSSAGPRPAARLTERAVAALPPLGVTTFVQREAA